MSTVHVLLLHLHGEHDEDDGEYGEDDEDVHVLILCLMDESVGEEDGDTSQRGRYASPRKIPCKSKIKMFYL